MAEDPLEVKKLQCLDYFHPDLDRHKSECVLLQNGCNGSFLVRSSSKESEYAVSVRSENAVKHFQLFWRENAFKFGHGTYETCEELAYHFCNKPLLAGESGKTCELIEPYPRVVPEPDVYEAVTVHAEDTFQERKNRRDYSINSKGGYLTKIGGIVKSWKVRWFVLQKNELKYFKDSSKSEPIRVLDLDECLGCAFEENFKDKVNVFSLKFNWRTFYMFAPSKEESQEWVRIINWRLDQRDNENK